MRVNRTVLGAASAAAILVVSLMAGQAVGGAATATGFDYAEALRDSMFFYAAQDSGSSRRTIRWTGGATPTPPTARTTA